MPISKIQSNSIADGAITADDLGNGTITIAKTNFIDSDSFKLPIGTTEQRPSSPEAGDLRFNTSNSQIETYDSPDWIAIGQAPQILTTTIATGDWADSSPWVATKAVSGILSSDNPVFDIDLSGITYDSVSDVISEWGNVYLGEASANDQIKLYATAAPAANFSLLIKVSR